MHVKQRRREAGAVAKSLDELRVLRCHLCAAEINEALDYQAVTGYVQRRHAGGSNHITLREVVEGKWACSSCVRKMKKGLNPGQESLV